MKLLDRASITALVIIITAQAQAGLTSEQRKMIPKSNTAIQCIVIGQIVKEEEVTINRYRELAYKYHNEQAVKVIFSTTRRTFSNVEKEMKQQYRTFGGDPDKFINYTGDIYNKKCLPLLDF